MAPRVLPAADPGFREKMEAQELLEEQRWRVLDDGCAPRSFWGPARERGENEDVGTPARPQPEEELAAARARSCFPCRRRLPRGRLGGVPPQPATAAAVADA